ncbi:hypothetical protein ABGB17_30300 [Sphaerisporangium sp. B11E5]
MPVISQLAATGAARPANPHAGSIPTGPYVPGAVNMINPDISYFLKERSE